MNAQEREAFWKTLCALPGLDLSQDAKQLMAAIRFPKLLFRYRPVNLNSLESLRTNRLYFSSANYYDDTFDTFLHLVVSMAREAGIKDIYKSIIDSKNRLNAVPVTLK